MLGVLPDMELRRLPSHPSMVGVPAASVELHVDGRLVVGYEAVVRVAHEVLDEVALHLASGVAHPALTSPPFVRKALGGIGLCGAHNDCAAIRDHVGGVDTNALVTMVHHLAPLGI
jgi:hypothetical protein